MFTRSKTHEGETLTLDQVTQIEILGAILDSLDPHHQRAMVAFYSEGETAERSAALGGMGIVPFMAIKREVRRRFNFIMDRSPGLDVFRDGGLRHA
jgi:hypothetical protein